MTSFVRVDYFKENVEWMRHCYNSKRKILQLLVTSYKELNRGTKTDSSSLIISRRKILH